MTTTEEEREWGANQDNAPERRSKKSFSSKLRAWGEWSTILFVFLLPLIHAAGSTMPDVFVKRALVLIFVFIALLLWLTAKTEEGEFKLTTNLLSWSASAVILFGLLATVSSPAIRDSFLGTTIEEGTFMGILLAFFVFFLVSTYARERQVLKRLLVALSLSATIILLAKLTHLLLGFSFFGYFASLVDTPLGKWNDFAIFYALGLILCLAALELLALAPVMKRWLWAGVVFTALAVFLVNFSLAWVLVGVFSIVTLLFKLTLHRRSEEEQKLFSFRSLSSTPSFVFIVLSLILLFGNQKINTAVVEPLQLGSLEVRPSWSSTYQIAKATLGESPLLGSGPHRFANQWLLHKPEGVNNDTFFWNIDFMAGVGTIPTFIITSGILGFLAWLVFLGSILVVGFRSVFAKAIPTHELALRYLVFISPVYLFSVAFVYFTDFLLWIYAFVMLGIFVAYQQKRVGTRVFVVSVYNQPKARFFFAGAIIVALVATVATGYIAGRRVVSAFVYHNTLANYTLNADLLRAQTSMGRVIAIDPTSDVYFRTLADAHLVELQRLVSTTDNTTSKDSLRENFQSALSRAITSARQATELNPLQYQNWITLARVYESVVPLKIEGSYELALQSYESALAGNPYSPEIRLRMARLELARGNREEARKRIGEALEKKRNYTAALFLLSQLDYADGNIKSAIATAEQVAFLAPQDIGVLFQLGFLRYLNREFAGAIEALERARSLNPEYANAKYFLGLSYDMRGEHAKAIVEFEDIARSNPDNAEVKKIVGNLKAKKPALSGIGAPGNEPGIRADLPIAEDGRSAENE